MRIKALSAFVVALVVFTGCASGSSSSLDGLITEDADSGMAPLRNGFSFANFGASSTEAQFDVNDLVTMFGASACIDGATDPCIPTAQATAWARMVNDARQSGHCEGLVVQAAARFNGQSQPATADLPRDDEVIHGVLRAFATQFLPEVQDSTKSWSGRTLVEIINELSESLRDGVTDYSMGLYSDQGGHAVLPFAVEFSSDTMAVIKVYDSNWPGMDRYVVVDFEKNQWYFSFSGRDPQADDCVWSGGPGDIDLTPFSARTQASCPFCGDKSTVTKSMLLIRSTSDAWSVETPTGTYSPSSDTTVDDLSARAIRTATCQDKMRLPEFLVSSTSLNMKITLPDDARAYISNGRSVIEVETRGSKTRKPIEVGRDAVVVNDPDTRTTVSNGNLAVTVTAPEARIGLGDESIEVTVKTDGGDRTVTVSPDKPRQAVTVENGNVVVEDTTTETSTVVPTVPEELRQFDQPAALPPATDRDLSNASYLDQVTTTTTTTTAASSPPGQSRPSTSTTSTTVAVNASPSPSTTAPTATTTTIPTVTVRIVVEDGEGGVRFGSTGDSYGMPAIYRGNDSLNAANCGPANSSLCHNKTYAVPVGWDFQFDWTLYADQYLYEMQCGTSAAWENPQTTVGSNTEVRWIATCSLSSLQSNQTITFRQR